MLEVDFAAAAMDWYDANARDLPWRADDVTAWGVLVSEVMLQQTPVPRVEPVWREWMRRWPDPGKLAAVPSGEAVRAWGRLGYPRRALRLHAAAGAITEQHAGVVPTDPAVLRELPGVGAYTAAAVAAFAGDRRVAVLDTNVRRVLARWRDGRAGPATSAPTVAEVAAAAAMVPATRPGRYAVAVMELGALVCTARTPACDRCPIAATCSWLALGRPGLDQPLGKGQAYAGTDRQVRGRLLALARDSVWPVAATEIARAWHDAAQRERALASLLADGLLVGDPETGYRLPD